MIYKLLNFIKLWATMWESLGSMGLSIILMKFSSAGSLKLRHNKTRIKLMFTSNPKTSCTDAPLVIMLWHAWLTNRKSNTPSNTIRAVPEKKNSSDTLMKWCNTTTQWLQIRQSNVKCFKISNAGAAQKICMSKKNDLVVS